MKILIADTETTGLGPDRRMVEVGWCEIGEDLGVISEFDSLINPECEIPCNVAGLHGIHNEDVYDAPLAEDIPWPTDDVFLICHNVSFDEYLLKNYMNITGSLCTMLLARRYLPECPDYKLGTLACYCEVPRQLAHRALGDVRSTLGVLDYICEGTGKGIFELAELLKKPVLIKNMPFGKHQGTPIRDLPKSYVSWLTQQSLDPDLKFTLDKVWR